MCPKTRRGFLDSLFTSREKKYDILQDPLVKKYANQKSPLGFKHHRASLSAYTGTWGDKQKIHLLRRTMFGVSPATLNALSSMTMSQAVDVIINAAPANPTPPLNYYENVYADPTLVPLGSTWVNAGFGDTTVNFYRLLSIKGWWIQNILNQSLSIEEKMIFFWHNYFVTESKVVSQALIQYPYLDLLRQHALGNFKQLVKEITKNPMMLLYLNGHYNIKNSPDENYARELQELFTLGKGTNLWTEDDVKAAAKVLTGFRVNSTSTGYVFSPAQHDSGNKVFSAFYNNHVVVGQPGANGENELDDLLNMIFNQDTTVAKHFCRRLYRFFIYYDIDTIIENDIISGLAQTLINNNWDVKPVLSQLFKSDHFYDTNTMDCLIRTPLDYYTGMMKTFVVDMPGSLGLEEEYKAYLKIASLCEQNGLEIGSPPSVSGWPAYYQSPQYHEMWINSDTIPKRMKNSDDILSTNGVYVTSNFKLKCDVIQFVQTLSDPSNPDTLIDDCLKYLFALTISQSKKDEFKSFLLSGQAQNYYWTNAWNDYITFPSNTTYEGIVRSRLQNMLVEMCRMAEYHLS
ncbi:MAG: DUF1800 domain-containing protein [Chitinophagaceae bacterium]